MERKPDYFRAYSNAGKSTPQSFQEVIQQDDYLALAPNVIYAPAYIWKQLRERTNELENIKNSRQTFIRSSAPVESTDLNQYWAGLPAYGRNKS